MTSQPNWKTVLYEGVKWVVIAFFEGLGIAFIAATLLSRASGVEPSKYVFLGGIVFLLISGLARAFKREEDVLSDRDTVVLIGFLLVLIAALVFLAAYMFQ